MESTDCECELVRLCGALHCPRCWALFSAAEDEPHAPQVLQCGHCLCRACVAADMARLWAPSAPAAPEAPATAPATAPAAANANAQPPCTCAVCSASYAPDGAHPVLPFFCAALAQVVAELKVHARLPPTSTSSTSSTSTSSTENAPAPGPEAAQHLPDEPDNVSEEDPAPPPSSPSQPQPAQEQQEQQQQGQQQEQGQQQQKFMYYGFDVVRADVRACVERWVEAHAGSMLGWLAPSRDTVRAQTDRAMASLVPAFVPFRVAHAARGSPSPPRPQCVWAAAPAEGRAAADAAARRVPWAAQHAHVCAPDERPRAGLWLPSAARAETAPRAVPRLPVVATAVAAAGAAAGAGTDADAGVQTVFVPFWVAEIDVQGRHTLLVCALDGTAVGARAPLVPQVRAARDALASSSSSSSSSTSGA